MTGAQLGQVVLAIVVIAPWAGYNLSRFHQPVTLSTGFGLTLSSANCIRTPLGLLMVSAGLAASLLSSSRSSAKTASSRCSGAAVK